MKSIFSGIAAAALLAPIMASASVNIGDAPRVEDMTSAQMEETIGTGRFYFQTKATSTWLYLWSRNVGQFQAYASPGTWHFNVSIPNGAGAQGICSSNQYGSFQKSVTMTSADVYLKCYW